MCNVGILSWEPKLYRTFAVSPCPTSFPFRPDISGMSGRDMFKEEEEELTSDPRNVNFPSRRDIRIGIMG